MFIASVTKGSSLLKDTPIKQSYTCFLFLTLYLEAKSYSFVTNVVRADIPLKVLFCFLSMPLFLYVAEKHQ